jgi:hypothetical protein
MSLIIILIYNEGLYKACQNSIVILQLLEDTVTNENRKDVVDDNYAKFRCDKALVVDIQSVKTDRSLQKDKSFYRKDFLYQKGKIVTADFNLDIDNVCASGIHYFKTKEAARSWYYSSKSIRPEDGL